MTHALIVDAYALFRASLRTILHTSGKFTDIIEATSSDEFLSLNGSGKSISLVVIYPRSIGLSESTCLQLASKALKRAHIVLFRDTDSPATHLSDDPRITVLSRAAKSSDVECAIRSSSHITPSHHLARNKASSQRPTLSRRQQQVMAMIAQGLANKEIAWRLGIAEGTVKAHIHGAFRALGVTNRIQAVLCYRPHLLAYE